MPFDVIPGGSRIVQAGTEGGKIVAAYGKPALEKSADLAAQPPARLSALPVRLFSLSPASQQPRYCRVWDLQTGGIQAGSAAAAIHSSIGNIAAGSLMAVGQCWCRREWSSNCQRCCTVGGCCDDCGKCWPGVC